MKEEKKWENIYVTFRVEDEENDKNEIYDGEEENKENGTGKGVCMI